MLAVLLAILPSLRSLLLLTSSPHLRLLVIPIQRPYPNRRVSRVSRHVSTLSEHMPQHVRRNFGGTSARIDVITSVVMHAMAEINSQLRMPRRPDLQPFCQPLPFASSAHLAVLFDSWSFHMDIRFAIVTRPTGTTQKALLVAVAELPPLRATPFNQHSMQDFLEAQDLRMIKT